MGLGPHGTSLLKRLGKSTEPSELLEIQLDQIARGEARKLARIRYGMKHKAKVKPLAPVEETNEGKVNKGERLWEWVGETIASKELFAGQLYSSGFIRKVGFKLPKLQKLKGKKGKIK